MYALKHPIPCHMWDSLRQPHSVDGATKSCSCFSSHLNPTCFLTISLKGVAKVLKSLTNILYKLAKPWKFLTSLTVLGVDHS